MSLSMHVIIQRLLIDYCCKQARKILSSDRFVLTSCADQARDAVGDAKARLNKAAEDAARSAQEAADSVRPHTAEVFLRRLYSCFLLVKSCKNTQLSDVGTDVGQWRQNTYFAEKQTRTV